MKYLKMENKIKAIIATITVTVIMVSDISKHPAIKLIIFYIHLSFFIVTYIAINMAAYVIKSPNRSLL